MNSKYTGEQVESILDSSSLSMDLFLHNGQFYIRSNRAITEQLCVVRQVRIRRSNHYPVGVSHTASNRNNRSFKGWQGLRGRTNGYDGKCELDLTLTGTIGGKYFYRITCEGSNLRQVIERKLGTPEGVITSHGYIKMNSYANLGIAVATRLNPSIGNAASIRGRIRYSYDVRCQFSMNKTTEGYGYRIH